MKYVYFLILIAVALLSLAAGVAKIMQVPQELAFFKQAGATTALLLPFGVIQVLGALLALIPKSRKSGLRLIAVMFSLSTAMIFITGNMVFGIVSLIPCVVAMLLTIWVPAKTSSAER